MRQKYMRHMGPHGLHGPGADGPGPMGLEDPPMGVYFRARGRWGPMGSMGLGDPPWGYHLVSSPHWENQQLSKKRCL